MIASNKSPFPRGYRRGYLAARDFFLSLRARSAAGKDIAPNELGCLLDRLHRRMDAAGGRATAERPLSPRNAAPTQQFQICPYPVFGRILALGGAETRAASIKSNSGSQVSKGRYCTSARRCSKKVYREGSWARTAR